MFHQLLQYINPEFVIKTFGVLGVLVAVFTETGLLFGILLPGDSLLFLAGMYSDYLLHDDMNIYMFILLVILAWVAWDQVWYHTWIKLGNNIYKIPESMFFRHKYVDEVKKFYDEYGKIAIAIGRFIPIFRTIVPIFAWVNKISAKDFLIYNIIWWVSRVSIFMWSWYILWKQFPEIKNHLELIWLCMVVISFWPIVYKYFFSKNSL